MDGQFRFGPWFIANWSRLAPVAAVVTLCTLPVLATDDNRKLVLALTLLPAYMIHQYEEHAHGRFLAFFNATVGKGYPVLTLLSICWINVAGVWAVLLAALLLARSIDIGFVFLPVCFVLVNALLHVLPAIATKRANPGLLTSLAIFLPLGLGLLVYFWTSVESSLLFGLLGFAIAIAEHAGIAVYAIRRRRAFIATAIVDRPLDRPAPLEVQ